MVNCSVRGCSNNTNSHTGITYHRIPKNTELRDRWIASIGHEGWNPTENARVCSDHFLEQDLDRTSPACIRIRLGAVPVIRSILFPVISSSICSNSTSSVVSSTRSSSSLPVAFIRPQNPNSIASPAITTLAASESRSSAEILVRVVNSNLTRSLVIPTRPSLQIFYAETSSPISTPTAPHTSSTFPDVPSASKPSYLLTTPEQTSGISHNVGEQSLTNCKNSVFETLRKVVLKRKMASAERSKASYRRKKLHTDWNKSGFDSPEIVALKRKLASAEQLNASYRKRLKLCNQTRRRLEQKAGKLKNVVRDLKNKTSFQDNSLILIESLSKPMSELVKLQCAKASNSSLPFHAIYSPELRTFAQTLHSYSPKAYKYVRKAVDLCLPHPRTLGKWCQHVDDRPDTTKETMNDSSTVNLTINSLP